MKKILALPVLIILAMSCTTLTAKTPKSIYATKEYKNREEIVKEAEKFQGIPYKKDGKIPETGFDCSGFTSFVFSLFNIKLLGSSSDISKLGFLKNLEFVQEGDLVFFGQKRNRNLKITLVGIWAKNCPYWKLDKDYKRYKNQK